MTATSEVSPADVAGIGGPIGHFIDGSWEPIDGPCDTVEDPSTGRVIASVPVSTAADVERAVAAARRAFEEGPWPRMRPAERERMLLRVADALESRAEEAARALSIDAGIPLRLSRVRHTQAAIGLIRLAAQNTALLTARSFPMFTEPALGYSEVQRIPLGVCAAFVPFNGPLSVGAAKIVAAAMGNTMVFKASPLAPLGLVELVRACEAADVPPGVVNLVHGGEEAGSALASHPDVAHVSFTGSTRVGRQIMQLASATLKRLTLELGGKGAALVLDDADMDLAARAVLFGAFINNGQLCSAGTRLVLPRSRHDEFVDRIVALASEFRIGPALDEATDVGPLISAASADRVGAIAQQAVAAGANPVVPGGRTTIDGVGNYYAPTILTEVPLDQPAWADELFGPVLSVVAYDTVEEAIALVNGSPYGLTNAVWGGDLRRARSVAERLLSGTVSINSHGGANPHAPFGGLKQSGFGRELGEEGAFEYTSSRHLWVSLEPDPARHRFGIVAPVLER